MTNNSTNPLTYSIPLRFRKMENLHILFWLLKDISWCLVWKPLAVMMIFPTLIIALIIAWRTRQVVSELTHNLAIAFWITANSMWMIAEFFHYDEEYFFNGLLTGKQLSLIPFFTGLCTLLYYYCWWQVKHPAKNEVMP